MLNDQTTRRDLLQSVGALSLVTLLSGGDVLGEQQVDLVAGENTVSFPVVVDEPGLARYQVRERTFAA